jgi:hypothetical protein
VVELKDADRAELQKAYADLRKEVRSGSLEVARDGRPTLNKDFEDTT